MDDKVICPVPAPGKNWPHYMQAAAQQNYLNAETGLLEAHRQGYSHWYIDGSLEGERPGDWPQTRLDALNAQIARLGVKPVYHGNFKAPLGSDVAQLREAALAYAKREVDLCQALGGAPLIVHGGGVVEPRLVREARRLGLLGLIVNLRALVAYAAERGVEVWLENLCNYTRFHPFYYICTTEDELVQVVEAVPGLRVFLDVSHAFVNGGDPVAFLDACVSRVAGMSFSDNNGDRDSHFPLGRGSMDYAALVERIRVHDWRGMIGFETRGGTLADALDHLNAL